MIWDISGHLRNVNHCDIRTGISACFSNVRVTPPSIGALEVGRAADMVLIDWREISYPYLDAETPLLDAVLQRAKTSSVRTVICDGDVIYHDAKFTRVDRDGALRALHEDLQRALSDDEVERRRLSKSLLPHVRAFYANYFDPEQHAPFYRQSSRQ